MEIRLWRELLIPYELAVKELVMKFNHLKKEHQEKDLYSPIEEVTGRVKSINSILEKMQRKNISWEELEEKVEIDVGELRVGDTIKVKDLPIASNTHIDLMTDPETPVVTVFEVHNAVEETDTEEGAEEAK